MFAWLFTQYRKPGKLHFGSKWLNLHGRLFIGSPERFGLQDCRDNVLTSYYYLRADRKIPVTDDGEFDAWKLDALRASQVRHASEKHVSKAGFIVTSTACLMLCAAAMIVQRVKATVPVSIGSLTPSQCQEKSDRGALFGAELSQCEKQAEEVHRRNRRGQ